MTFGIMISVSFICKSQYFILFFVSMSKLKKKMKTVNLTRNKPGGGVQCLEIKTNH